MNSKIETLFVYAPVSGKTIDITKVPDDVFAQKMVGDGIAIIPDSDVLSAPADGVVDNIHASKHALTLTTAHGVHILMHIGLETVHLKGKGFNVKVKAGQSVKKGDALIEFDLDYIQKTAKSTMSVIVVTNPDKLREIKAFDDKQVETARDVIMELSVADENVTDKNEKKGKEIRTALSWGIRIVNPTGIHARPAAVLVNAAKRYRSNVFLQRGTDEANAKSLTSLMGMDLKKDDEVTLFAKGDDAVDALETLIPLVQSGLGEKEETSAAADTSETVPENGGKTPRIEGEFKGVAASEGVAVGQIIQLKNETYDIVEAGDDPADEKLHLLVALQSAKEQLESLYRETVQKTGEEKAAIFLAHLELLDDPELMQDADALIGKGKSAAFAFAHAADAQAQKLEKMKNKMLAGRANDLRDVKKRVVGLLVGGRVTEKNYPENTLLLAQDLTPSQAAGLDTRKIVGFGTVHGGATSHAAILARALSIPAIVGLSPEILHIPDGTPAVLDAGAGVLRLNPKEDEIRQVGQKRQAEVKTRADEKKAASLPAKTTDGVEIDVAGNISGLGEVQSLLDNGGSGVGLLRSEFLFADRQTPPSVAEQEKIYADIASGLGKDRYLVIRTLDAGGDKPLPYLKMPAEENPFLGVRGIRLSLQKPDIFREQIRAILKASGKAKIRVLLPMVCVMEEISAAQNIITFEAEKLGVPTVETGIMIEIPAAAAMADVFARHVDFFSIGTNDLSQYVMSADRGNAAVAALDDTFNPAVLRAIKATTDGARRHNKPVALCGNMASEELAVPLLIGLGVEELSVAVPVIAHIKACVRQLNFQKCQEFAQQALSFETAQEVREKTREFWAQFNGKGEK